VSLPYWGFYLRSLIATGDHRRALNEIRFTLRLHKTLPWATLAFGLLPKIWEGLGVRGFSWEPEWGIQPLVDSLNRVPKPSLVSLVTGDSYQLIEDLTCDVPAEKGPGSESLF